MLEPVAVDPEVAAALLRSHLEDYFKNSPRVRDEAWTFTITENPLIAIVQMPARQLDAAGGTDVYTLQLDGTFYDTWPVLVTFVEPNDGGWKRARIGSSAFPLLRGSPGAPVGEGVEFQFALHDDYQFSDGTWDQLICFSYNLGYYTSSHVPNENQKWRPGKDRVDATLSRIHRALGGQAYLGRSNR